jgi:hypothetical protein
VATRDLGSGAGAFNIAWSGIDYVADAGDGISFRTWRLSRLVDVLATSEVVSPLIPRSMARCGEFVIATWTANARLHSLPAGSTSWSDGISWPYATVAAERGDGRAVLLSAGSDGLATREVIAPIPSRRRAAR